MDASVESEWLIVIFGDQLRLGFFWDEPPRAFTDGESTFRETGHGALVAFYDRLVDARGELSGIRVYAVSGTEHHLRRLPAAEYIRREPEDSIFDIVFFPQATQELRSTAEQAFGGFWYLSENEVLALSIDFSYLAARENDRDSLRAASADWPSLATA